MWYTYMRRDGQYLRSYRTHNLWLDFYHKKMRVPKIDAFHGAIMKRMSKSVSGVSLWSPDFGICLFLTEGVLCFDRCECSACSTPSRF